VAANTRTKIINAKLIMQPIKPHGIIKLIINLKIIA
jgi:hypothetical protein